MIVCFDSRHREGCGVDEPIGDEKDCSGDGVCEKDRDRLPDAAPVEVDRISQDWAGVAWLDQGDVSSGVPSIPTGQQRRSECARRQSPPRKEKSPIERT